MKNPFKIPRNHRLLAAVSAFGTTVWQDRPDELGHSSKSRAAPAKPQRCQGIISIAACYMEMLDDWAARE